MRVRDHVLISAAAAAITAPLSGRDAAGLLAGGVLIDADHYAWFCLRQRRFSPLAAARFFGEADPPQHAATRALHAPAALAAAALLGLRYRLLRPIVLGMILHAALDKHHMARMGAARAAALTRDGYSCQCAARHAGRRDAPLPTACPTALVPNAEPRLLVRPVPRGRALAEGNGAMDVAAARGRTSRARTVAVRGGTGLTVGVVLIVTFLKLVNASSVYQRLEHLDVGVALLCGATFLAAYVVRAFRWRTLLLPNRVSVRHAIAIYQVAIFLNWLLPVRGGEIAMSLLLRHTTGIPVSESLPAVGMDKALDMLPSAILLALMPLAGLPLTGALWVVLAGAVAAGCFGIGFLLLAAWRRDLAVALLACPFEALLRGRTRESVRPFFADFTGTLIGLFRRPKVLLIAGAYTAVAVGLDALFCLLAFRAVGVAVPVLVVLYGYTLFNLSFILPSPPGQVGSNELIGLLVFSGIFRVNRAGVGAMFLFSHPFTGALMACGGLMCLSAMSLNLRSTFRIAQEHQEHQDDQLELDQRADAKFQAIEQEVDDQAERLEKR